MRRRRRGGAHLRPGTNRRYGGRIATAIAVLASSLAVATVATTSPAGSEVPGDTTDASLDPPIGDSGSYDTDLSADGQVVAFTTTDDEVDEQRVYVYDVPTGTHELVSVFAADSDDTLLDGSQPSISGDGNRVAMAVSLLLRDELHSVVVLRDRAAETTGVVSPIIEDGSTRTLRLRSASQPAISDDGNQVAYVAEVIEGPFGDASCEDGIDNDGDGLIDLGEEGGDGSDADPGCDASPEDVVPASVQVYVRDAEAATPPILVSHMPGQPDVPPDGRSSIAPAISGDGERIVFLSDADLDDDPATDVQAGATNVWMWERSTNEVTLVSRTTSGGAAAIGCQAFTDLNGVERHGVDISADGRYASFSCRDDDLVDDDGHVGFDVFVADLDTGDIELVSTTSEGLPAEAESISGFGTKLSADGRYVVFGSDATNLLDGPDDAPPTDPVTEYQVYVRDRAGSRTTRVSLDDDGAELSGMGHFLPSISASGRYVTWTTVNLDEGPVIRSLADTTAAAVAAGITAQAYHRDRLPLLVVDPTAIDFGSVPQGSPSAPVLVTVRNDGFGPLDVVDIVPGGADAASFEVSGSTCTESLHRGDTCTFAVRFLGGAAGTYAADVTVTSTAPGPAGTVGLAATSFPPRGGGTTPGPCEIDPASCEEPEPTCETDPDPERCPPEDPCVIDPASCEEPEEPGGGPEDPCVIDPASCDPGPDPGLPGPEILPDDTTRQPTLRVSPSVVRLGRVTIVTGEGWVPDTLVTVALDEPDRVGATTEAFVVRTDGEGRIKRAIVIPHRIEQVGPRTAVAIDERGAVARDDYLVALPSVGASTSFVVRVRGGSLVLVPARGVNGIAPVNRTR